MHVAFGVLLVVLGTACAVIAAAVTRIRYVQDESSNWARWFTLGGSKYELVWRMRLAFGVGSAILLVAGVVIIARSLN